MIKYAPFKAAMNFAWLMIRIPDIFHILDGAAKKLYGRQRVRLPATSESLSTERARRLV